MALFARLTAQDSTKISVHRFGAALRQWAAGQLTRQQVIDAFTLTGTDITELDALRASYDALGTGNATAAFNKGARLNFMEDVFLLCETGDYTEAKAKSALGF
jgi:hypothetical protein